MLHNHIRNIFSTYLKLIVWFLFLFFILILNFLLLNPFILHQITRLSFFLLFLTWYFLFYIYNFKFWVLGYPKFENIAYFLVLKLYAIEIEFFAAILGCFAIVVFENFLHFCWIFFRSKKIFVVIKKLEVLIREGILDIAEDFGCFEEIVIAHGFKNFVHMIMMLAYIFFYLFHHCFQ